MGPSTPLNPPNSAASVGSGGCVSDGGQKEEVEERRDAPVLKLASEGLTKANNPKKSYLFSLLGLISQQHSGVMGRPPYGAVFSFLNAV